MAARIDIRSIAQGTKPWGRSRRTFTIPRAAWLSAAATLGLILAVFYFAGAGSKQRRYVTVQAERGPIIRAVSGTGTLNPVTTVQVGSYVSGPIIAIYADFNSAVKKGQ